jgi:hypothetical protein
MPLTLPEIKEFLEVVVRDSSSIDNWKQLFPHPYRPEMPHEHHLYESKAVIVYLRRNDIFEYYLGAVERKAEETPRLGGDRNPYREALRDPRPTNYFTLEVALFRAHLRAIWEADTPVAQFQGLKALAEYAVSPRMAVVPPGQSSGPIWNSDMVQVATWLRENLDSLKICANSDCNKKTRYFIVGTGYKYCSVDCTGEGEANNRAKRKAKLEALVPPQQNRTLSAEARQRIADAQKRRWAKAKGEAAPSNHEERSPA